MFTGVLVMPSAFVVVSRLGGDYALAYAVAGVLAAASGLLLLGGKESRPR